MKRRAMPLALFVSFALPAGVFCLLAQSVQPRDAYRAAYRAWREGDPTLERDAGATGDALTPRAAKVADSAAAYGASRRAFLQDVANQVAQNLPWLRDAEIRPVPDLSPAPNLITFTDREIGGVGASVAAFANDPDRAIQQVRQASQRELAALQALKASIASRQMAQEMAAKAASAAEQARARAMEQYPILSSVLTQTAELMKAESTVWAEYYPALAEGARTAAATPVTQPVSNAPISSLPAPSTPSGAPGQTSRPVASADPASPAPRAPSITPLPLSRYVGGWAYQAGGAFHGTEPQIVDVTVREENGHVTGTLYARFKLPVGSIDDPVLILDFSGDLRPTRNQTFEVETSEGAKGTIDLIPGGPFNVLEINFETEIKPRKVHQGDLLLVKQ